MQYLIAEGDDMISEAEGAATRDARDDCRRADELEATKKKRIDSGLGRKKTSRD